MHTFLFTPEKKSLSYCVTKYSEKCIDKNKISIQNDSIVQIAGKGPPGEVTGDQRSIFTF